MGAHFLSRFVAGIVLSIPLVALGIGIYALFQLFQWLGEPVFGLVDTGTAWDPWIEHGLALFFALFTIYLLGFVAELPFVHNRVMRLDGLLKTLVPGYTMIKGVIGGVVKDDSLLDGLRPVLVLMGEGDRIGFEIERTESGRVVVFLPNAPAASSGIIMAFAEDKVERLSIPPHKVMDLLSFYGAGLSSVVMDELAKRRPD